MNRASARQAEPRWTLPNALVVVRLVGAPALLVLAGQGWATAFLAWLLVLLATDWLDGKLATWLKQHSAFGARLDSVADGAMYACAALGLYALKPDTIAHATPALLAAGATYLLTGAVAMYRFRRWPSYHLWSAKLAWAAVTGAAIAVLLDLATWPLHLALALVALSNVEGLIVTFALPRWRANVPSAYHAIRHGGEGPVSIWVSPLWSRWLTGRRGDADRGDPRRPDR